MRWARLVTLIMALLAATRVHATPVLISQQPWGQDQDAQNFSAVFGPSGFTFYNSFAAANPAAIFDTANRFVMVEGGAGSDVPFQAWLTANQTSILNWVAGGGVLLLQSAGWDAGTYGIGPDQLVQDWYVDASNCGTLTAAGSQLVRGVPATQCGDYLAHDYVTGSGFITLMTGSNTGVPILAEAPFGAGDILYSGLTDSEWHSDGSGLMNAIIAGGANLLQVSEPAGLVLLLAGVVGVVAARRSACASRVAPLNQSETARLNNADPSGFKCENASPK